MRLYCTDGGLDRQIRVFRSLVLSIESTLVFIKWKRCVVSFAFTLVAGKCKVHPNDTEVTGRISGGGLYTY